MHNMDFALKRSTLSANFVLASETGNAQENQEFVGAVFVDFKQAFDRVSHSELIRKMKKLLIPPIITDCRKTT
jgi:hypothetical protein